MSLLKGPTPFYSSLRFLHIQQQDPTLVNLINWKNEYSVGVDEIDAQHKNLLDMLNTLLQAIVEKTSKEGMEKVLEEMINYVDFHFKSEEKYTKPHPNFSEHRLEHWQFVKTTMEFQKKFGRNENISIQEIFEFLVNWLTNHIIGTDVRDFTYLRKNNLLKETP